MKKENVIEIEGTSLRQKAEEKLTKKYAAQVEPPSESDVVKLLHELEVHQIELEMQNDELRLARDKAETSTEKLIAIYNFAPAGYFTLDSEGTIVRLNHSGARMLGKGRSVLVNNNFKQFVTPDTRNVFNDFLQKVLETNSKQTCEVRLTFQGNPSNYIHIEGIVSEDVQKCLITAVDISERKQAEEKLQDSETRYRRLFESAKDGILILDAHSGQIVDVNPFLIHMIGYSYEELLGKELWELGVFKNIAASIDAFTELQKKEYIRFEEMPLETKNGELVNVEFVSNVYLVDHKKVIQCNIRDITDRKKIEEALQESETRFRELNITKDKFFSIISHDLRSPFNSILGYSKLLVKQVLENNNEGLLEYAGIIQKSSLQALNLVTNLIDWSRSQSGRMEFLPESIEMVALICEIIEFSVDSAKQKSITISMELPHNAIVFADKDMISTVLRNLISNAIKYTNEGGTIVISAKQEQDNLTVSVGDNGVGIDKDSIDKLFRIEESSTTMGTQKERGTGLGLLLCKEFIDKHDGKIWAESEPDKGSIFYVTLPKL